ncbi:LIM domain family protein [Brugia pahangi]|uniref:LIM zinc-binding domain-containing protein n=1 Tax=Brugia pahangi TaxID=6280 RepID=A0A0N4TNL9_BRUPA|nr:unnamed protein product [Brugia pahangi]
MQSKAEIGRSHSNSISKIFETSGLTLLTSNELPEKPEGRWLIRCNSCNEPVTRKQALMRNVIYSLNKIWHREHFTCIHCKCIVGFDGRPFRKYRYNSNYPICMDCYMEEFHPKCYACNKSLRETCVKALKKYWHRCCFVCTKCHSPFENGMYLLYNDKPYDVDCYYLTRYENQFTAVISNQSSPITEPTETNHKTIHQITEKTEQKSQSVKTELQFPSTTQNTEIKKHIATPTPTKAISESKSHETAISALSPSVGHNAHDKKPTKKAAS